MIETKLNKTLFEFNGTTKNYSSDQCTHHLFEDQVERTPDAHALVFGHHCLSYAMLNNQANQLARYLQKLGVGPETLVGICLDRSLEMVISILAIFKAGGAYVPLDPTYPQARLRWMLEDAKVFILLTQAHLKNTLPTSLRIICLDLQWTEIAKESVENLKQLVCPKHLAYVIYTSGSTGKPKGVMVEHRGVSNLVLAQIQCFDVQSHSRVLQFSSLSFDASFWEIVMALGSGACLCLAPRESILPGPPLLHCLRRQAITHVTLPPSALAVLPREEIPSLRCIIVAGEPCPAELATYWQTHCRFFNAYGPTESTVCATIADIHPPVSERLPIGFPLPNIQIYILDEQKLPVQMGETGELYIGGIGLARGYLNRPELTQEQFIPHPFMPEGRLYKSGDLARWLPDGQIEFLGRIDEQIKLRGFRIELGEIETVLAQHPAVQQAVVILKEDKQGDKHLIAYLTVQSQSTQEHIAHQQSISEQVYSQTHQVQEATFNLSGWNSSYTGQAISEDEMREWVEQTVARIAAFNPCKVLEIGCGMGLLLSRIAPQCQRYVGLDFSHQAVEYVKKIKHATKDLEHVIVLQRTAEELTDFEPQAFDTVIINSVIQAFPHVDYLLQTLQRACALVKLGGRVIIGDVRHFGLLEAYHTSVQIYRASHQTSCAQLRQKIHYHLAREEELLVDPHFFLALPHFIPEITHVQVQPKRGMYHNELTKFRYEAILHIGTSNPPISTIEWITWHEHTPEAIRHLLLHTQPKILGIRNIPNARLHLERQARQWLQSASSQDTVAQFHAWLAQKTHTGIEPDDLWNLSQDTSYHIELSWLSAHPEGHYDIVLTSQTLPWQPALFVEKTPPPFWGTYVHTPSPTGQLIPQWREFLKSKLPEYMLPSAFVILETWPLTPNGKIDRQALAQLPLETKTTEDPLIAPRNALETTLVEIWSEILGVERIGIYDDFFEWGGNSLKAIAIFNRLQKQFNRTFQLRDLFQAPTISEFVAYMEEASPSKEETFPETSAYPLPSLIQEKTYYAIKGTAEQACSLYNIPYGFHLTGKLDIQILEASFNALLHRHEILRTTLQEIDGHLVQVISPQAQINFSILSLIGKTAEDIATCIQEEQRRPFYLDQDYVMRVTVLQLETETFILLLCMYGIIPDNWSLGILFKELSILYEAFLAQRPSPLPPLPIQYKDYAQWQRQLPAREILEAKLNYWKQWFQPGMPSISKFPMDKTLPATQTFRSGIQPCHFTSEVVQKLHTLSQQTDTTVFMILLATYAVFLSHHSGCQDIIIGAPFANRNRWQFESLIGAMVNMLVLRIDVNVNLDFIELLSQVRQVVLDALTYQDFPFEQLVKTLPWTLPYPAVPLPQAHLSFFKESPMEQLKLPGLKTSFLNIEGVLARDIFLVVWENTQEDILQGWWQYKKDLFEPSTIIKLAKNFEQLLENIVTHPKQTVNILLQHLFIARSG